MTIIQVNEIWQGRDGSGDASGEQQYSRTYRVRTDSNFDTAVEATNHPFIPVIGTLFPSDNTAFCQRVTATQETFSPRVWIVTASYSNKQEVTANPLSDPTEFTWDTDQYQREYWFDRNGDAILNSAGDPFFPPIQGDDSRTTVRMTRNVVTVPVWFLLTRDKLNTSPVTIDGISVSAERAKVQKVSAGKRQFRNNVSFRTITMTLHVQDESWEREIVDMGFRYKSAGKMKKITSDGDGTEPSTPSHLNGSGGVLLNPTTANTVKKSYDIYGTFDFNELPF